MIVPVLTCHLKGNQHGNNGSDSCTYHGGELQPLQEVVKSGYTHTYPDGKRVERTGIGVVSLTGLTWGLVDIHHNGKPRHKEEEKYHPKALYSSCSSHQLEYNA